MTKARLPILIVFLYMLSFSSCTKQGNGNKPTLSFVSWSQSVIPSNFDGTFNCRLNLSGQNGQLLDSIRVQRVSVICPDIVNVTQSFKVPSFVSTPTTKVEATVYFATTILQSPPTFYVTKCTLGRRDTTQFKIWVTDVAGNSSDTITTPSVIIQP